MSPESSQPGEPVSQEPVPIGEIIGDASPQELVSSLQEPETAHGYVNEEHRKLESDITALHGSIRAIDEEIQRMESQQDPADPAQKTELFQMRRRRSDMSAAIMEYSQRIEALKSD